MCAVCGADTEKLKRVLRAAYKAFPGWWYPEEKKILNLLRFNQGKSFWEADHILEVIRDGPNTLENLQTLCVPCHKDKTARLAQERALERRDSKRGLLCSQDEPLTGSELVV